MKRRSSASSHSAIGSGKDLRKGTKCHMFRDLLPMLDTSFFGCVRPGGVETSADTELLYL